jgi:polyisoprenoid-binding protein YceI
MKTTLTILALCLFTSGLRADLWGGTSQITFDGTSTLHAWGGKVSAEPFQADVTLEGEKPVRVVSRVTVKSAKMETAEEKRDENMRKAMMVTDHPFILGEIDAKFDEIAPSSTPTKLPMTLTLLGKPQKVNATISNWKLSGKKATFDLDFDLSLKKSGITVPTVLLFIKVGDVMKMHASVKLTRP